MFWECLSKVVPPYFGNLKLKLKEENSWVISKRIKYWNINCWEGLSLSTSTCLREEDKSIVFQSGNAQLLASWFLPEIDVFKG